jgi:hypothetical protein
LPDTVPAMLALSDRRDVEFLGKDEEAVVRVAVVDDQRLFAKGLSGLVDMLPETMVVGVAYDGEEAVELCRKEEPDVVLTWRRRGIRRYSSVRTKAPTCLSWT